eukprot:TRINITY_DN287_c0_g1_i1.p1 TRINITY_DN287_c0_g1~~TRINITY_DN287_c0_g1_i1.p1  ORF type:complete len:182 (+),score=26.96 TRINITY_DN287_c0_g1_i1:37-582(+)
MFFFFSSYHTLLPSKMSKTNENLKVAFAGESQANRKYLAFAQKAEAEGFKTVAKLFRAAAEAETVHAMNHLKNMDGVKTTAENLKEAFEGETYEHEVMYPPMVKTAEEEHHKAKVGLMGAMAAEGYHANLYKMALDAVKTGKDMAPMEIWYCPVCGHIEYGANPPAKCPICGLPAAKYIKM